MKLFKWDINDAPSRLNSIELNLISFKELNILPDHEKQEFLNNEDVSQLVLVLIKVNYSLSCRI